MKTFKVCLYHPTEYRYFYHTFQASDHWEARRYLDMQFAGVEWNGLTEC